MLGYIILLHNPGWSWTDDPPTSAYWVLGLYHTLSYACYLTVHMLTAICYLICVYLSFACNLLFCSELQHSLNSLPVFPSFASVTPWNRKIYLPWSLLSTSLPPLFLLFPQKLTRRCWTDSALDKNLWFSKVNGPNFSKHYALIPKSLCTDINSFVESVMSEWHFLQGHGPQAGRALLRQQHKDPVWRREQQDLHGKELSTQDRNTMPTPRRW